jgi:hypothetical protein
VYETDLQTMVRIFFQQNVELRTEIAQMPGKQGSGWVRVTLIKGTIVACLIKWKNGEVLSGPEALRIVERLGSLAWDYTALTPGELSSSMPQQRKSPQNTSEAAQPFIAQREHSPTVPSQGAQSQSASRSSLQAAMVPVRTRSVPQQQFAEWPRAYRSVFNLIDGHNSIEKIANLLAKPYEAVASIITDLYKQGIIVFPARPFKW